jgi:integrase
MSETSSPDEETYVSAWRRWLANEKTAGRLTLNSSSDVYEDMWFALAKWGSEHGIRLSQLTTDGLSQFLASRQQGVALSERYIWRFLRLVDRVLRSCNREAMQPTVASVLLESYPEYQHANATHKDPLPTSLADSDATRLIDYLESRHTGPHVEGPWQECRNAASVALMLGAGATPAEVRDLTIEDLLITGGRASGIPWKLRIVGDTKSPEREAPLAPWAGHVLAYWLAVRQTVAIPGTRVFPSTKSGKPWSKDSQYSATKKVLGAAKVEQGEGGSYLLRHTFALRQLRHGTAPAEVARWLGVTDPDVMQRYQRFLTEHPEII